MTFLHPCFPSDRLVGYRVFALVAAAGLAVTVFGAEPPAAADTKAAAPSPAKEAPAAESGKAPAETALPPETAAPAPPSTPPQKAVDSGPPEKVRLSFTGANIDLIVKWLAELTGKSISKHKEVNCQLTILSPRELPRREAIQLVYRALALEGFVAVETASVITIVPEKMVE